MSRDRRQDIIDAAIELFARNGFRGTTTRDLAAQAGVNEAIIFRHFATKEALYSAILETKACEKRADEGIANLEALAAGRDDVKFFETVSRTFLQRHESDLSFMRLLLFSALEGHELSEMFLATMATRNPLATYIARRVEEGAFRKVDPELAARALLGMFVSYLQWQELFAQKKNKTYDREEVVRTFVSIFLAGITKESTL
jgi:AcrR family transcriptional regulator